MAKRSLIDAALEGFQRLSGDFDPRYDPRVKEQERLRNLSLQVQERGTQDAPRIPLTDLEGRGFVTTMSDRTRAGGLLTGINDTELSYPVNLQGGQGYMFENPGQVWASAPGVVNQIMREAGKVRSSTGQEPAYIPFRMAPTGGDFAKKTGETMLAYASASMNKKNKKSLDKSMKQFIPDWLGVDNPDSIAQYRAMSDKKRKAIKQMLDRDFRDKDGLNIGEARLAVSDPSQINAKDAGVQNVGQIFTDRPTIIGSGHPSYPYGVPGEGLGTLNRDIGIFDLLPEVVRERGIPDPSVPRQTDIRALQMKPYSGVIDEALLRDLEARGIDINSPAYAGLLAAITAGAMMAPEDAEAATAYKLFRQANDKLYPLFVNRNQEVPVGEWLKAEAGELTDQGKVKSSLGPLAYRPGWHAGDLPMATHIGGKSGPVKAPNYRPSDQVWAEVEFPEDVDWQAIADANATRNKAGEIIPRTAQITDQVPYGGFYRYKTNPNMTGEWLIGGDMRVNRVLSDEEVRAINESAGVADLPRLQSIKDKTMLSAPAVGVGLLGAVVDPVEQRVQQLMQPLAQESGYNYGDILPIKRSTDPARREEFPYGLEPAIPNMARGLLEEAVRAYEMNKAGRQREATQSAMGLLF
jgi:hypothetical protein